MWWNRRSERLIEDHLSRLRLSTWELKALISNLSADDRQAVRVGLSQALLRYARFDSRWTLMAAVSVAPALLACFSIATFATFAIYGYHFIYTGSALCGLLLYGVAYLAV